MPSPRVATARELQFAQREITLSVAIHRWSDGSVLFVKVRILWTRHPIYTSMLCILLGTGFMITPWRMLLVASLVFIVGMEIRVRVEDRLLASRFGEQFLAYRRSVPAYVPFLR